MDAPLCIACSTKHWSRMPCPAKMTAKEVVSKIMAVGKVPVDPAVQWAGHPVTSVVSNAPVTNAVTNIETVLPTPDASTFVTVVKVERSGLAVRQAKWREANREKHRALERERMRQKRAKV